MDFRLPPPVQAFRDQLRAWLADNLTDEVREASRRRGAGDDALAVLRAWDRTMADAGWAAISWPVEYGGRGASALEQLVFTEETIAASSSRTSPRSVTTCWEPTTPAGGGRSPACPPGRSRSPAGRRR